jgi:RNA polymerase sigma-70 factor (ECF subfamily)
MRCREARQLASDYLDDDLAVRRRGQVDLHLKACPTCPALYAGLVGVRAALGTLTKERNDGNSGTDR